MDSYLLIESRDPFESRDSTTFLFNLAAELVGAGHPVTVLLVQNGTLIARHGAVLPALTSAQRAGVRVVADDFSLAERGIRAEQMVPGVESRPIDVVVEHMVAGDRVIWH